MQTVEHLESTMTESGEEHTSEVNLNADFSGFQLSDQSKFGFSLTTLVIDIWDKRERVYPRKAPVASHDLLGANVCCDWSQKCVCQY